MIQFPLLYPCLYCLYCFFSSNNMLWYFWSCCSFFSFCSDYCDDDDDDDEYERQRTAKVVIKNVFTENESESIECDSSFMSMRLCMTEISHSNEFFLPFPFSFIHLSYSWFAHFLRSHFLQFSSLLYAEYIMRMKYVRYSTVIWEKRDFFVSVKASFVKCWLWLVYRFVRG